MPGWASRRARPILDTLDQAIADKAEVRVVAYDLNVPEVVGRFEKLGKRLRIIIDDSKEHGQQDVRRDADREAARKDSPARST